MALLAPAGAWAASSFPSGLWRGEGRLTGGFRGKGASVRIASGGEFEFCLRSRRGVVSSSASRWMLEPTVLSETLRSGGADTTGHVSGGGMLSGRTSSVEMSGSESFKITISIAGFTITEPLTVPVVAKLPVTSTSRHRVSGELAIVARHAQQGAGFTSDERGSYSAEPVSSCRL